MSSIAEHIKNQQHSKPEVPRYTYDQLVAELPESNQACELWDGELVMSPTPSFYHQKIALRFYRWLAEWVEQRGLGEVVAAPIDMVLSPHRVVQPDVLFIAKERSHIIQRVIMGPADLVAEVVSLGGRQRDRIEKRDLYEQYCVREYWIIDPESQSVEILFLDAGRYVLEARCTVGDTAGSRLLPGLEVPVSGLFSGSPE
jgi:Uma2 family endonuclease